MEGLIPFLSILGAVTLGAISPGPSFVFVVRTSLALSRRDGIAAALGMGAGGVIFAGLALFGLQAVLAKIAWLYAALRLAGGLYLLLPAFRPRRLAGRSRSDARGGGGFRHQAPRAAFPRRSLSALPRSARARPGPSHARRLLFPVAL